MYVTGSCLFSYPKTWKDRAKGALINRHHGEIGLTLEIKWRSGKRCLTTDLLKSTSSPMSSSRICHRLIRKYPPYNHCPNHNKFRLQRVVLNKRESITRTCVSHAHERNELLTLSQVVVLLQGKLADVGVNFKEVLEVRTKNLQASRSRTENFVSSVSAHSQPPLNPQQSASPLYNTPTKSRTPQPGYQNSNNDILNLDPGSSSALMQSGAQSDQQLLMMEEAQPQNTYINMRGEAIDMIERTINELGGVFGQLAAMVSEQGLVHLLRSVDSISNDSAANRYSG